MTNVISLDDHQRKCDAEADAIIGEALRLRSKLKGAINLPLPDEATDHLVQALSVFIAAAEAHPR